MADYKRYDGYVMNVPQKFIDSKLPVCPFCGSNNPHWLLKSKMEMSLAGSRTYYRCEQCEATMSSTAADAGAEDGKNFRINPAMAAMSAAEKGTKGQQVGVAYMRVEELGRVCTDQSLLHQEQPITFFQERIGMLPASAPAPAASHAPVQAAAPAAPAQKPIAYDTQTGAPIYATPAAPAATPAPERKPIRYDTQTGAPIYAEDEPAQPVQAVAVPMPAQATPVAATPAYIPTPETAVAKENGALAKLFLFLFIFAAVGAGRSLFSMTIGRLITNALYRFIGYHSYTPMVYVFSIFALLFTTAFVIIKCILLMKASKQTDEPMKKKMWLIGAIVSLSAQGVSALYNLINYIIALADGYPSFSNGFTVFLALLAPAAVLLTAVTFINSKQTTVKVLAIVTLASVGTNLLLSLIGVPYAASSIFSFLAAAATAVFYFFVSKSYRKQ